MIIRPKVDIQFSFHTLYTKSARINGVTLYLNCCPNATIFQMPTNPPQPGPVTALINPVAIVVVNHRPRRRRCWSRSPRGGRPRSRRGSSLGSVGQRYAECYVPVAEAPALTVGERDRDRPQRAPAATLGPSADVVARGVVHILPDANLHVGRARGLGNGERRAANRDNHHESNETPTLHWRRTIGSALSAVKHPAVLSP